MNMNNRAPFNMRPVVREAFSIKGDDLRGLHRTATCNFHYITRTVGADQFGPTPDFTEKLGDLVETGRRGPKGCHRLAIAGLALWQKTDAIAAHDRPDAATAMHLVADLPEDGCLADWRNLVQRFLDDHFVGEGMVTDWAIHDPSRRDPTSTTPPHWHGLVTLRAWKGDNFGRRNPRWLTSEAASRELFRAWMTLIGDFRPIVRGV